MTWGSDRCRGSLRGNWLPSGGVVRGLDPESFLAFGDRRFCKVAWGFLIQECDGRTTLSTETCVLCLSGNARHRFAPYWALIRPFGGLIRRAMLRAVKEEAEIPSSILLEALEKGDQGPMANSESMAVVRGLYEAINNRDFRGVLSLLHPDVSAETPEGQAVVGGRYRGPNELIEGLWGRLGKAWNPLVPEIAEYLDCDEGRVVTLGRYHGANKATGKTLDASFAHVWTVRDGKVVGLRVYTDTAIWNEAWGKRPQGGRA